MDLLRTRTSSQVLDWIAQIAAKPWANDQTLAGLVRALDDILYLQAHVCPQGAMRGADGPVHEITMDDVITLIKRAPVASGEHS